MGGISGIGIASLILVGGILCSRALGVARNIVLASTFGAGPELDAYFAAFRLPDTLFQLIAGSALGSAFLPTFSATFSQISHAAAWRLASATLTTFTAAGGVAAFIAALLAPWLVPLTVPGFSPEMQALTTDLTRIMLWSTVFFCASGMLTGVLNARFHFLLPSLAPSLYNLSIIIACLVFAPRAGIHAPAWGVAAGAAAHLLIQLPGARLVAMRFTWNAGPRTPGLADVARLMGPRVLALASGQINWFVATILASTLAAGSVTGLNYAWALLMMPLALFGMAPATAALPSLSEAAAESDWERYRGTLLAGLRLTLFLAIPAAVGLIVVREPLIRLLFERGLFDAESTRLTAAALLAFAIGLPAHVVLELASRGSYAVRDTRTPFVWALLGMGTNGLLSLLLIGPLGLAGLAFAMSLAASFEAIGLLAAVTRPIARFPWRALGATALRALVASAVMAAAVAAVLTPWAGESHPLQLLVLLAGSAAVGVAVFIGVAMLLRSTEVPLLIAQLPLLSRFSHGRS